MVDEKVQYLFFVPVWRAAGKLETWRAAAGRRLLSVVPGRPTLWAESLAWKLALARQTGPKFALEPFADPVVYLP